MTLGFDPVALESALFASTMVLYSLSVLGYFLLFALKSEKAGKAATLVISLAFAAHTLSLAVRGISAGRVPLTNMFEFSSGFAWGISLSWLAFTRRHRYPALGAFAAPLILLIIGYAALQSRQVNELVPALKSNWLALHVSTAVLAYGAFGLSFAFGLVVLLHGRLSAGGFRQKHLPEPARLDLFSYRMISFGFLFLTLVIVTGAIWAERAWGSYWSWDPKETWSLVTWLIYALYLHLRVSRGWKGKKAAWFAVAGFLCVIFTYIGVNAFIPSIHSYA